MSLSRGDITAAAAELLETPVLEAVRLPAGHANETWRVTAATGALFVVKIGPLGYALKWRSAHQALDLAAAAGLPVARLVRSAAQGDRLVRAFAWVEGRAPEPAELGPEGVRRLFTDLGAALRALHGIECDGFTSRLDGSAPSFARWPDYLSVRIEAIAARCRATGALAESELERVLAAVEKLMAQVGDEGRPTLCHRDLYVDNLLVDPSGRLAAILDFDTAEVWDHAGEFDKLDRLLIPAFPDARRWFDEAYWAGRSRPPHWEERVRLVTLIEALNTLPNAIISGWDKAFANEAHARIRSIIELC